MKVLLQIVGQVREDLVTGDAPPTGSGKSERSLPFHDPDYRDDPIGT